MHPLVRSLACWAALLWLSVARLTAQNEAVAAFDSGYVETGNPFVLHLAVPETAGQPAAVDWAPWDTLLPQQNVLKQTGWQRRDGKWTNDLTCIVFDSAQWQLPPLGIVSASGDTLYTNGLELSVLPSPAPNDPADMQDIKDIYREPVDWRDYLRPAAPILAGILLFALILWWFWWRPKKTGLKGARAFQQPPHTLALRRLTELERRRYEQQGRLKEYYTELTHILREYVERRYEIPALESPSEDLLRLLLRTDMPAPLLGPMSDLLRWADLAKFAQGQPPEHFHTQALQFVRQLVEQTQARPASDLQAPTEPTKS